MSRTTTEPMCNMTLTRDEWAVLVRLLDVCCRNPCSTPARQAIREALNADAESASVGIYRECEKWAGVIQAIHNEACKRGGEYGRVLASMTRQWSAAAFCGEW